MTRFRSCFTDIIFCRRTVDGGDTRNGRQPVTTNGRSTGVTALRRSTRAGLTTGSGTTVENPGQTLVAMNETLRRQSSNKNNFNFEESIML